MGFICDLLEGCHTNRPTIQMFCTTSETEGEFGAVRPIKVPHPVLYYCDRSKAVALLWFSVVWFCSQSLGYVSPYVCSYFIFSSVKGAEWPPFLEIAAHSVDHLFTLYSGYL